MTHASPETDPAPETDPVVDTNPAPEVEPDLDPASDLDPAPGSALDPESEPTPLADPEPTPVPATPPTIQNPGHADVLVSTTVEINGVASGGDTIDVMDGNLQLATTLADPTTGEWGVALELNNGQHSVWAQAITPAGMQSSASETITFVVDTTPEPGPEPTEVEGKLADFFRRHIVGHVKLHYQEYLVLQHLAKEWLDEFDSRPEPSDQTPLGD